MSAQTDPPATSAGAARPTTPGETWLRARLPSLGAAALCVVLAIYLGLNGRDARLVRQANESGKAGRYREAVRTAERVSTAPADARALLVRARALTAQGDPTAEDVWAALARRDPNNWQVFWEWSASRAGLGHSVPAILEPYARARELNPKLPAP